MRLLVVPIFVCAFIVTTTSSDKPEFFEDYGTAVEPTGDSAEAPQPQPEGRILGSLLKGWKGDDDGHPLTEFGKIHIINRGKGYAHAHGPQGHGHGHRHGGGGGEGWGWGQYGPGYTTYHHTTGWKAPSKKKSWLKLPHKAFGIHLKAGVGFSAGEKKGGHKGQTVVVQQHNTGGWGWNNGWNNGWNSGHQNSYGWGGWGNEGGHGGHGDHYGGDYYDDDTGAKEKESVDHDDEPEVGNDDDDDDRRRMDLGDYLYEY